jgi:hypothetical protein
MRSREERLAANEALFREVNERVSDIGERFGLDTLHVVCECVKSDCTEGFEMTTGDYEALRSSGTTFAVVPEHEQLDVEKVVGRHDSYLIVEKIGAGAQVAEDLDPR